MVGVTPYGVRSPRSASQHVTGIKKDTRAMEGVRGMMIMFLSLFSGIKNNTRAVVGAVV